MGLFITLAGLALAFGFAWPQDFRATDPFDVRLAWAALLVRVFTFHIGLAAGLVAAVAAWHGFRRLLLAALPLLALALGPTLWQFRPRAAPPVAGEAFTVMSVNLLAVNHQTAPIVAEIRQADPDLLLLQEYTPDWHEALQAAMGPAYPHRRKIMRMDSFGTAIYSKRPFVGDVELYAPLGEGLEPQFIAAVELGGREVAIYNIHLLPPRSLEYVIEGRRQFADLLDLLRKETRPVVVAGDFNFTEQAPQAARLADLGLTDAADLGGWGRGATWPVLSFLRYVPGIRLDHIYLSDELTCTDCRTGAGQGSDHRPVIAKIGLAASPR